MDGARTQQEEAGGGRGKSEWECESHRIWHARFVRHIVDARLLYIILRIFFAGYSKLHSGCKHHTRTAEYLTHHPQGQWRRSTAVFRETSPFGATAGRSRHEMKTQTDGGQAVVCCASLH